MSALDSSHSINVLENIAISSSDVYNALTALDPSKTQGIDRISPKVWKKSAPVLYYPLHHLFTKCLANITLPTEWQIHTITPIFKSGDRSAIKNYRPISLLCIVSKVLERLVYDKILPFLLQQLTVFQFGFLPNRSAIQQLLSVANIVQEALATNKCVDIIYLDFKKAFDSVTHSRLLSKLWYLGIRGTGSRLTLDQEDSVCALTNLSLVWCLFSQEFPRGAFSAHSYLLYLLTIYHLMSR